MYPIAKIISKVVTLFCCYTLVVLFINPSHEKMFLVTFWAQVLISFRVATAIIVFIASKKVDWFVNLSTEPTAMEKLKAKYLSFDGAIPIVCGFLLMLAFSILLGIHGEIAFGLAVFVSYWISVISDVELKFAIEDALTKKMESKV